jgi:hypothetical protein
MPEYDINSDNPLEMVWAIREKIYEETKHMTQEERMTRTSQQAAECRRMMQEINPDDYDLSFLHTKVGNEK